MKILAVDDDERVRTTLCEMFSRFGHEYKMAANGREALSILQKDYFPIIVSDIRMPAMDGIEFLKEVKEHHPDIDVISITGHSNDYTFVDMVKAGASDFIHKPFSKDELEAKIGRIVRERELKSDIISSRNKLMAIFNGIRDGMYSIDYDFQILSANKALAETVGLPVEDIIGRQCYEIVNGGVTPCEGDDHSCPAKRAFARGLPAVAIHKCLKDDKESYIEITAMPLTGDSGRTTQVILFNRDITSKFLGEKRLKESEMKYRTLVEMTHEGIISTNKEGIITVFNKKAEEIFDYPREEVIGRNISMLIPEKDCAILEAECEKVERLIRKKSVESSIEAMGLRRNGSKIMLEISISALKNEQGELATILFVKSDEQADML